MKFKYKKACQCGIKAFVIAGALGISCLMSSCSDEDKTPDSDKHKQQSTPVKAEPEPAEVAQPAVVAQPEPVVQSNSTPASSDSLYTMLALSQEADAALTEILSILGGINSRQSADAAVPRLQNAYNRLNAASAKLEKININMSEMMNASEADFDKLDRLGTRLEQNSSVLMRQALRIGMQDCYGSSKLSKFFDEIE